MFPSRVWFVTAGQEHLFIREEPALRPDVGQHTGTVAAAGCTAREPESLR